MRRLTLPAGAPWGQRRAGCHGAPDVALPGSRDRVCPDPAARVRQSAPYFCAAAARCSSTLDLIKLLCCCCCKVASPAICMLGSVDTGTGCLAGFACHFEWYCASQELPLSVLYVRRVGPLLDISLHMQQCRQGSRCCRRVGGHCEQRQRG